MGSQTFLLVLSISCLRFCGGTCGGSVGDHTTSPFCAIHQESPHDTRQAYPTSFWPTSFDDHAQLSTRVWDLEPPIYDDGGPDQSSPSNLVNVDDFGAVGDGLTDDTKAFGKAWKEACSSLAAQSVMMVPEDKNYLLKPIKFRGPCKSSVQVMIRGTIQASSNLSDWNESGQRRWLWFENINGLQVEGGGTIDGNGEIWWNQSCKIDKSQPCKGAPTALTFASCKGLAVKDLKIRNSQQIHLSFQKCQSVEAANLTIMAPERSPNTDGIHVTGTQNINIEDSVIGTGDDCISIVSGSKNIKATNIKCGPGHGISIGSLGKGNSEDHVSEVVVDGAKIVGTTNGVRIKTWQGGSGYARNIKFQNIEMENVTRPIIIDQYYCDSSKPCPEQKSAVEISNVLYKNIEGTSASKVAVEFDCSESFPCKEIVLEDINLVGAGGEDTESSCKNVQGTAQGKIRGTIQASSNLSDWNESGQRRWLWFENINGLQVEGGGTIDGNGEIWWNQSCKIDKSQPCKGAPTALTFASCKGLVVKDLKIRNSQQIHLSFQKCQSVEAANLTIIAPERSPNTDGIHVTATQNINIEDSVIGTGDDCISIVSGSKNIKATNITCGPGHGISIGSLGKGNSEDHVSQVMVDGAKIFGTTNGVRIKTWQGGSGNARSIKFQNIEMKNVTRPIIIDQNYCDSSKPCREQKSAVKISDVVYRNIGGTSASKVALEFDCSKSIPCQGILLKDINLVGAGGEATESSCKNVHGTAQGKVYPPSCL